MLITIQALPDISAISVLEQIFILTESDKTDIEGFIMDTIVPYIETNYSNTTIDDIFIDFFIKLSEDKISIDNWFKKKYSFTFEI